MAGGRDGGDGSATVVVVEWRSKLRVGLGRSVNGMVATTWTLIVMAKVCFGGRCRRHGKVRRHRHERFFSS